jgi:hypothetical protein
MTIEFLHPPGTVGRFLNESADHDPAQPASRVGQISAGARGALFATRSRCSPGPRITAF